MTSSKVILVGAISVVFGLYSLSLMRVDGAVGRTAEIAMYLAKASDNARSGVQCALYHYQRGSFFPSYDLLLDSAGVDQGSIHYDAAKILVGSTYRLTVTSHGTYKSPTEPAAFLGHEVIRTAYIEFPSTQTSNVYDVRLKAAYSSINYARERQLDSLQTGKSNLIGY